MNSVNGPGYNSTSSHSIPISPICLSSHHCSLSCLTVADLYANCDQGTFYVNEITHVLVIYSVIFSPASSVPSSAHEQNTVIGMTFSELFTT